MSEKLGNPPNFTPYVQIFEFEALLLSAPDVIGEFTHSAGLAEDLGSALASVPNPEAIN
jgi:hypothetical protein